MEMLWSLSVKAALLVAAAWMAALALRRASAATRHTVWACAIGGLAFLPALLFLLPAWPVAGLPVSTWSVTAGAAPGTEKSLWPTFVLAIWAAGCLVSLARVARSALAVRRLARSAAPAPPEDQTHCRVLQSDWTGSPVTWGIQHPTILLPASAAEWSEERRRIVLAHELAHIERQDWMWQIIARLTLAVYWFHPLAWLAAAKLREESERACDDLVLREVKASDYAAHLVEIAKVLRQAAPGRLLALSMIRLPELERRLRHILSGNRSRKTVGRRAQIAAVAAAVLLVVPVAAMQNRPGKVYKIGGDVTSPTLRHKVEPEYTQEARDAKIQGTVILGIEVDATGHVAAERVVRSLDPGLDQKALEAVRQWTFNPAMRKGKPVRVTARVEVNFKLK